jgi:hypothetical protein
MQMYIDGSEHRQSVGSLRGVADRYLLPWSRLRPCRRLAEAGTSMAGSSLVHRVRNGAETSLFLSRLFYTYLVFSWADMLDKKIFALEWLHFTSKM